MQNRSFILPISDSALKVLGKYHIPLPDVLITSLGTEINYMPNLTRDTAWSHHSELTVTENIYFADKPFASGMPAVIEYYDCFRDCKVTS